MKKQFILPLLSLLVLAGCNGGDKKADEAAKTETVPTVRLQTVHNETVNQDAQYTATVEPEVFNNIVSSTPTRIKQILVDEGQNVSKGQRLVVLDDVSLFSYETQVDNAKASLKNIEVNYNRALELYKIGGGTKQQVDQMEIQLINAKNALATAQRALRNARENTVLTSPISGVVTKRNYDPGDMPGQSPILTVARTNPVKIVINATESELPRITKGMPATVTFDTYGDETFQGRVAAIMPTVDAATRTFGVEITLPNPGGKILPGMFGRVHLNLGKADRVVVPDKAVVKQQGSGNHYVYVYQKDGTVKYNKVELGQRLGDRYELISGVESGAQVVVNGHAQLSNGAKVNIAK